MVREVNASFKEKIKLFPQKNINFSDQAISTSCSTMHLLTFYIRAV